MPVNSSAQMLPLVRSIAQAEGVSLPGSEAATGLGSMYSPPDRTSIPIPLMSASIGTTNRAAFFSSSFGTAPGIPQVNARSTYGSNFTFPQQ
jgi:hypothetical protein